MATGFPITNYQICLIKKYSKIISISVITVIILSNIITFFVKNNVNVNVSSYILIDGFPLFTSQSAYINLLKNYPHDPGVNLQIHKINKGESFWDVIRRYKISTDTLIAANPFLTSLHAKEGDELVIPAENGVLLAFNDIIDVWRMSKRLNYNDEIKGDYKPSIFELISPDDIRFVFFKNVRPVIISTQLKKLYSYKKLFESPITGYYTSLFGNRFNPLINGMGFHNGLDIQAKYGTPIYPSREGLVIFSGWRGGYGKTIIIQHRGGYSTLYGHCSSIKVKKGKWVTRKDIIGLIGSTGRSTGPHLHFTFMRHGEPLNPLLFIW